MGIQDRDWYREWHREKSRASRSPVTAVAASRLGLPGWAIWIVVIFVGLIAAKLALDFRKKVVPFPLTGQVHWYIGHPGGPLARLTLQA
ncbi:MAG: hypothetical protein V4792_05220, partial [Pseudomonadota bacterium]